MDGERGDPVGHRRPLLGLDPVAPLEGRGRPFPRLSSWSSTRCLRTSSIPWAFRNLRSASMRAVSAYLEARARQERVHRVTVSRRLEHEVLKAFQRLPRPVRDSLSASPLDSVTDHPAESPVPGTGGNHPAAPSIEIRLAGREDIGVAAHILEEAIAWARRRGFDSWAPGEFASPESGGRLQLLQAVETGGLYLVFVEGQAVGTMSLLPEGPLFWPGSPPVALYLHRFAIRGPHTGRGVGVAAPAWAEHEVMRRGRRLIRLDCLADNPGIRAYYERAGFEHRGDVEVEGTRFSLYEREAGK